MIAMPEARKDSWSRDGVESVVGALAMEEKNNGSVRECHGGL
jgi:hypothetical protein